VINLDGVNLFNLPVDNMERAKKFFNKTFGWTFMPTGMEGNHHFATTVQTDENGLPVKPGGINGGLLQRDTYKQQVTSIFIKVNSIDITLNNVKKNGGKLILAKIAVLDFAYFAQIEDTEGNLISLWEDRK
jgi:predicted enzyme related to lactoylglutathione lyase